MLRLETSPIWYKKYFNVLRKMHGDNSKTQTSARPSPYLRRCNDYFHHVLPNRRRAVTCQPEWRYRKYYISLVFNLFEKYIPSYDRNDK